MSVLKLLKNPTYLLVAFGVSFLVFDLQYYMMTQLPGYRDYQCILGGSLTLGNILFSIGMALLAGLMAVGFWEARKKRSKKAVASSVGGIGVVIGTFTVFCPLCSLPVISVFGVAFGLGFFTTYNLVFKAVSLVLMFGGLWILNQQLNDECKICKV